MLNSMSTQQFEEWIAFYSLEPFGDMRDDLRAGSIVAAVYNVNRAKASSPVLSPHDGAIKFAKPVKPLTPEEQKKYDRIAFDEFKEAVRAAAMEGSSR